MEQQKHFNDTICALSSPQGTGAIAIIRISGEKSISVAETIIKRRNANNIEAHKVYRGIIYDGDRDIDDIVFIYYKAPRSFTGEDIVEINCHGSRYIQKEILHLLVKQGIRPAQPGEFSMRAYMNGKIDLTQAEAISDLIQSNSRASHRIAMNQAKGGFSTELAKLRAELLTLCSLLELELDFGEEEVEFANRTDLIRLIEKINVNVERLISTFSYGNAIKNGIPVAIAGKPNVGKSTLLNCLLRDEKAIVSPIAGTTRDSIEDTIELGGIEFRFIDTAGLRTTTDGIELIGINRARKKIEQAKIVLLVTEPDIKEEEIEEQIQDLKLEKDQQLILVKNKSDIYTESIVKSDHYPILSVSAKEGINIIKLEELLIMMVSKTESSDSDVIINNLRHYNILQQILISGLKAKKSIQDNIPTDLVSMDVREMIEYLGEITGHISNDEVLGNIFKNFCIGK